MSHRGRFFSHARERARVDAGRVLQAQGADATTAVDPARFAEAMGVRLHDAAGSSSGFHSRFASGHQLGHLVERGHMASPGTTRSARADDVCTGLSAVYANEFAVALLLPETAFRQARAEGMDDLGLAKRFGVPPAVVRWRAMHLT